MSIALGHGHNFSLLSKSARFHYITLLSKKPLETTRPKARPQTLPYKKWQLGKSDRQPSPYKLLRYNIRIFVPQGYPTIPYFSLNKKPSRLIKFNFAKKIMLFRAFKSRFYIDIDIEERRKCIRLAEATSLNWKRRAILNLGICYCILVSRAAKLHQGPRHLF